jgi:membrane fusion protein (multidrug efflux system)
MWMHFSPSKRVKSETSGANKKLPLVVVKPALVKDIKDSIYLTGTIEPTKVAVMASPAEGPIVKCFVREGDIVSRDQVLVMVGRRHAAEATVLAAREELNKQADEFERIKKLVEGGAISGDQLDIAKTNLEKAKAALASAEMQEGDYSIRAPWDGIISKVWIAEGNYVAPRSNLVEIFAPESMILRIEVPEAKSGHVKKGTPLTALIDAHPGRVFHGKISRVYPQLDTRLRTRSVEATLDELDDLIPGMFTRVQITLNMVSNAITVPSDALLFQQDGKKIIFTTKDGKAFRRVVTTGIEEAGNIQIISGIDPGDYVVVSGQEKLKDGVDIRLSGMPSEKDEISKKDISKEVSR